MYYLHWVLNLEESLHWLSVNGDCDYSDILETNNTYNNYK